MAEANPRVMEMIAAELKKKPDTSNAELLEKAKSIDKGVAKLSPRQFNAMYPLQVKRAMKPPRPRKRKSRGQTAAANGRRDRVRTLLLGLARDVANAQGKGELVDLVAGIDGYVDKVMKAAK